ncbi:DUF2336 domain-containing protein [Afipia birgiae]|jgi:uncharacterized protein (DUF2336 family)|uniref:DUF2336 domain-containing protein n=1 Tax=Afipia birgiae TaxID=151414 RepID=UPI0002EDEA29|nr:DUF2336 domain-containing protein [Afipia birgiae]
MIVRQFISWVRTAPAGERAEATRCLARAWLVSDLSEDDRAAAEGALLMLLDDASPLVRQAMAEIFAHSMDAPPAIIAALAVDQASVAVPILEHSPLLLDSDLVDIVATGNPETQCAIARRFDLPPSVCAAIAEVGCASSALELIENRAAQLAPFSLARIADRHGHLAAIRESLLTLDDLPAAVRLELAQKLSDTLTQLVTARDWLHPDRARRIAGEAMERSTVNIAAQTRGADMTALVGHLRSIGQLNTGLILRALLSGNIELFEGSLVELSGLPASRVAAIVHDRGGASLNALLAKAGLPESTYRAFRAALEASNEIGFIGTVAGATRLRRRMVERVLTQCETSETVSEPLLILLRRFATESAREEARLFCDDLAAEDFVGTLSAHAEAEQIRDYTYEPDAIYPEQQEHTVDAAYALVEEYDEAEDYASAEEYVPVEDYVCIDEYAPAEDDAEAKEYAAAERCAAQEYKEVRGHYSYDDYRYDDRRIAA